MQTKKLFIVGAGGHGRAVAEAAELTHAWGEIVFIDDRFPAQKGSGGWPIIANTAQISSCVAAGDCAVVAIGNQQIRAALSRQLVELDANLTTIVHPKALVSGNASIDCGVTIMAGAVIGIGAVIGRASIINANATVDHDCQLGEFSHLGVGVQLAGGVVVGERAWLQAGSCAGYNVRISSDSVILPGMALIATNG